MGRRDKAPKKAEPGESYGAPLMVGVAGSSRGVGTTHFSIMESWERKLPCWSAMTAGILPG